MHGLLFSLRNLRNLVSSLVQSHQQLLTKVDSLQLDSSIVSSIQHHPSKFLIDIFSFEEVAKLVNELKQNDTAIQQAVSHLYQQIQPIDKIQRMARNLKLHLFQIKDRIYRQNKILQASYKKIGSIIKEFRERCKIQHSEFLKNLDYDLRKILKPLVPSSVIDENIKFPRITSSSSLLSSANHEFTQQIGPQSEVPVEESEGENAQDKLNDHINMLVNTLETVAKDLIQVLAETNRKYFQFTDPEQAGSCPPTPLAAPLPEYFTFQMARSHEQEPEKLKLDEGEIKKLQGKIQSLVRQGDLDTRQARKISLNLHEMVQKELECDFNLLFKETDLSMTKREELVYKLINPEKKSNLKTNRVSKSNKLSESRCSASSISIHKKEGISHQEREEIVTTISSPTPSSLYHTPAHKAFEHSNKPRAGFQRRKHKESRESEKRQPFQKPNQPPQRNRKELRVRSITPGASDKTRSYRKVKTPIPKRFKNLIK